jgi:hypothetical protein
MLQVEKSHWPRQKQASNVKKAAPKSCKMHVKNMSKTCQKTVISGHFQVEISLFPRHNRVYRHHLRNLEIKVHGGPG